jgi:hypothetical protein
MYKAKKLAGQRRRGICRLPYVLPSLSYFSHLVIRVELGQHDHRQLCWVSDPPSQHRRHVQYVFDAEPCENLRQIIPLRAQKWLWSCKLGNVLAFGAEPDIVFVECFRVCVSDLVG